MNRTEILQQAADLLGNDRQADYGDAFDTHERIAAMWTVILGGPIKADEVALCMTAVKLVRAAKKPGHHDSYVDAAAYAALAGEFAGRA